MALKHPVVVYNALNNVEAQLVSNFLNDAGVEAFALADVSQVGVWMFGHIPEIHKPQVWVDRDSVEQAAELLQDFERRQAERRHPSSTDGGNDPIEAVCEECGCPSEFLRSQQGTVQDCPHCGKTMDVEDPTMTETWWREAETHEQCDERE